MNRLIEHTGPARLGKRTKELVRRLGSDDIAIIDHTDIDRVSAEELVESGVRVVVNVSPSQSGRYPNPGPLLLVRGGVRLIDVTDTELFDEISDGERLTVRGASLFRNGTCLATGRTLDEHELAAALLDQQGRVTEALQDFADNTLRYLREEGRLLTEGIDFPPLETGSATVTRSSSRAAPATSATSGWCGRTCATSGPCSSAVDGGAEALLEEGWKPDVIVGDMDSVTDETLRCGAEILVHAYSEGHAPGEERLRRLGVPFQTVAAPGISEDIAMLLAHEKGAELIVAVGTHFNLVEFLERSRAGMSSTFVTRLKVGEILIDAKGVSRLVSRRIGVWPLVALRPGRARRARRRRARLAGAAERVRPLGWPLVFDLRYHVASLAAVFLMLVVGILIGVGISGRGFVDDAERRAFNDRIAGLQEQVDASKATADDFQRRQKAAQDFVESAYPVLVKSRLAGKNVAVAVLGSVEQGSFRFVERALDDADGRLERMRAVMVPLRLDAVEAVLAERPSWAATSARSISETSAAISAASSSRGVRRRSGTPSPARSSRSNRATSPIPSTGSS